MLKDGFDTPLRRARDGRARTGLDRHQWESELSALEDQLAENPAEALPELDALAARMLGASGYSVGDPVTREGDDFEVVAEFLAAHEITLAAEHGSDEISPGDIAAAINGYRAVFDHVRESRAGGELGAGDSEQPE